MNFKKEKRLNSINGAIVAVDIMGFSSNDRSDIDRKELRAVLSKMIARAFTSSHIGKNEFQANDAGDGYVCFPNPNANKAELLTKFIPSLTDELKKHNSVATPKRKFKLRLVLHSAEYIRDENPVGGKGFVGQEINMAFRLLD